MPTRFSAGLMQVFERRARKLKLASGFKADIAVWPAKRNHMIALNNRFPTKARQPGKQIANPARFIIGWRAVVACAVHKFLMLGADAPAFFGLFAASKNRNQVGAAFDDRIIFAGIGACAHAIGHNAEL